MAVLYLAALDYAVLWSHFKLLLYTLLYCAVLYYYSRLRGALVKLCYATPYYAILY